MRAWVGLLITVVAACGNKKEAAPSEATMTEAKTEATKAAPPAHATVDAAAAQVANPSPTPARPEWITSDTPSKGTCSDRTGGLDCVGVSAFVADEKVAKPAAIAVALDAMMLEVAREANAVKEKRTFTPNDQSSVPDMMIAMAHKEIDTALKITPASPPVPTDWHWETYAKQSGSGTETLGFARLSLAPDARKKIVEKLAQAK
jgi:hypothetical protein